MFLHIVIHGLSVGTRTGAVSASGAFGASLAVSVQTDAFVIDSTGARIQAFQTATNVSGNAAVTTNGMLFCCISQLLLDRLFLNTLSTV